MDYDIQELAPILAELTAEYNSKTGTTADRDKTKQLMGAVEFCINEVVKNTEATEVACENLSAAQSYACGLKIVKDKIKDAEESYKDVLLSFNSYGNIFYESTIKKEVVFFFQHYDAVFNPQLTMNMGYPLLVNLSLLKGIDKVEAFLHYIKMEQVFLKSLPQDFVKKTIEDYRTLNPNTNQNLCGIILDAMVRHALVGKPLNQFEITEAENRRIKLMVKQDGAKKLYSNAIIAVELFAKMAFEDSDEFMDYISDLVMESIERFT